jgi:alpha/beta superfamily hydrolase
VLRFNFRGVGRSSSSFDGGPGEKDDFRAALDFVHDRYPGVPLWAAGMSFGSWIALSVGADDPRVSTHRDLDAPVALRLHGGRGKLKAKFFIRRA